MERQKSFIVDIAIRHTVPALFAFTAMPLIGLHFSANYRRGMDIEAASQQGFCEARFAGERIQCHHIPCIFH
jgi:hypothetical protein